MVASKTEKASSSRQEKVHQSTRNLRLRIFFSVFLDLLAFTAILPHFPTLVKNVGGTSGEADTATTHLLRSLAALIGMPIHHPLHYVVLGGLIGTLLSLGSFLSGPCLGYVADNTILGRRRSLLLTLGISFVAHLGMVLCTTVDRVTNTVAVPLVWLLVLRFFTGVGKSNVSLSVAILDDAALHEGDAQKIAAARKKGVAMIGIAYAVGFLVGPPLSVWMMRGLGVSFVKWSLFAQGVAFLFTCISIPETRRDMPGCAHRSEDSRPCLQSEVFASLKNETVSATRYTINPCHLFSPSHNLVPIPLHTVYFLFLMLYSSAEFSLAFLQLTLMRNTSVHRQAFSYVWIGTVMILVQGGYVRRTQCSSSAILFQGLVSFFIALLILVMFSMQPGLCFLFYIALTFMGFSSATVVSSATTLALNLAQAYIDNRKPNAEDREHKVISALVTSRLRSAGHLARACGPFVGSIWFALKGEAIFFLTHASLLGLLICYTFYIFRHVIKS